MQVLSYLKEQFSAVNTWSLLTLLPNNEDCRDCAWLHEEWLLDCTESAGVPREPLRMLWLSHIVSCSLTGPAPTFRALLGVAFNSLWICSKKQKSSEGPAITPPTAANFSENLHHSNRGRQPRRNAKVSVKCTWSSVSQARIQRVYSAY